MRDPLAVATAEEQRAFQNGYSARCRKDAGIACTPNYYSGQLLESWEAGYTEANTELLFLDYEIAQEFPVTYYYYCAPPHLADPDLDDYEILQRLAEDV